MHYLPYVAVAFLFLFHISESKSAPNHGFLTRDEGHYHQNENESDRNGEIWNEVLAAPRNFNPELEHDGSFESKFSSNENDRESIPNQLQLGEIPRSELGDSDDEEDQRRNQMSLAKFATLLSNPEDFESNVRNGIGRPSQVLSNDLWKALDQRYRDSANANANKNFYPKVQSGHTYFPRFTADKLDTHPLIKRNPECLRQCFKQRLLHPAQCHSMC